MDKREQLQKRNNLITLFVGIVLSIGLLFIYREGLVWFRNTHWIEVEVTQWIAIVLFLGLGLVLQYYFLLLLRYSFLKYLVLWFIPIAWLFNNGIVAMHRFLDWTTDIVSPAGWIPIGDLMGWMLSAIFAPLLIASGAIVAIIDSSSSTLTQACYYARIAMDVVDISVWDFFSYISNFISFYWDLISNSFVQEVIRESSNDRSFLELNLSNTFSLPYWVQSTGYSFTCVVM